MSQPISAPLCAFCGSPIKLGARKCPSCLEFLDGRQDNKHQNPALQVEATKGLFDLLGKAAIPAALIAALFMFRTEISEKLTGAESIQIGSYGIKFRFPESQGGSVELEALSLYYLLYTAKQPSDYKGGMNYSSLRPADLTAVETLRSSGLVTSVITEVSDEEARKRFGIKKTLTLKITDKGRSFLRSAKLAGIFPQEKNPTAPSQ